MATAPLSLWNDALPGTRVAGLGRLSLAFGSSRVAGPAYQERPTRGALGRGVFAPVQEAIPFPPVGSLTMGRRPEPPIPLIILSTGRDPIARPCYPGGNFGGNQLSGSSIGLSPLYPRQTSDLHVSYAADFHRNFFRLHPAWA